MAHGHIKRGHYELNLLYLLADPVGPALQNCPFDHSVTFQLLQIVHSALRYTNSCLAARRDQRLGRVRVIQKGLYCSYIL